MKSNAKMVPASAPSLKSRGMRMKNNPPVGSKKPLDHNVSKKHEEAFQGKDK